MISWILAGISSMLALYTLYLNYKDAKKEKDSKKINE